MSTIMNLEKEKEDLLQLKDENSKNQDEINTLKNSLSSL